YFFGYAFVIVYALAATADLRRRGPAVVLVTSLTRTGAPEGCIEMLADGPDGAHLVATPRLDFDLAPNGSGDLTAALFLAHWLSGRNPARALELAAAAGF
ncbi:hypothetical protein JZU48_00880, partial [bacterium]|nr:hypothetical protein [bacterium]